MPPGTVRGLLRRFINVGALKSIPQLPEQLDRSGPAARWLASLQKVPPVPLMAKMSTTVPPEKMALMWSVSWVHVEATLLAPLLNATCLSCPSCHPGRAEQFEALRQLAAYLVTACSKVAEQLGALHDTVEDVVQEHDCSDEEWSRVATARARMDLAGLLPASLPACTPGSCAHEAT